MPVKTYPRLQWAAASDTGRKRTHNEDRYIADEEHGLFAVIDGVGGHAAGEQAAKIAADVLKERLARQSGSPEIRLREAIALANNEIFRLSRSRPEWLGMACVLTVALIEDDVVTVGHVGDSRLYLLRPGEIQKVTHDHSPVGEREDRGELSEEEAMNHARRNEIFRDVGSTERKPDETGFIEIHSLPIPADGALLLCTDGLSDLISSAEIRAGIERYAPNYEQAIGALIDAANHAGGKDNITVILLAGAKYKSPTDDPARTTRSSRLRRGVLIAFAMLVLGIAIGVLTGIATRRIAVAPGPRTIIVGSGGIAAALAQAHSGDTIVIPQGRYRERVEMREGVRIRAEQPGSVTLISPDGGAAVEAKHISSGSIEGVWIQGDLQAPLSVGIDLIDASPAITNVKVTGAAVGIALKGASSPLITSSQIVNNQGPGLEIGGTAHPRIEGNLIAANGNGMSGSASPGIDTAAGARPVLKDNGIVDNAAEPIWVHDHAFAAADFQENFFGDLTSDEAIRVIGDWRPADPPRPVSKTKPAVHAADRKAEDRKAEERKAEDRKAEDRKAEDRRAEDRKGVDQKEP